MVRPEKKAARKAKRLASSGGSAEARAGAEKAPRGGPDVWSESFGHEPVMLAEAMEALEVRPDGFYVDGTLGGGGHARAILERLGPEGRLLGLDVDPGPLEFARRWGADEPGLTLARLNFKGLADHLAESGLGPADGVIVDLGPSSKQLLTPERGLSFSHDGPLDMRLDPDSELTAGDIVNNWPEEDLSDIFRRLGEDRASRRLAAAVVAERASGPIDSTSRLAAVAQRVSGRFGPPPRIHPATRMFMGLRLAVNGELEALTTFLARARECLKPGGRLVVISFHSLEDRLVKEALRGERPVKGEARAPGKGPGEESAEAVWRPWRRKVIKPSEAETARNPRARSAKLRAAEAVGGGGRD
jgi:16S rRNA (cytosine1402-N4)-methyltransferase